MAENTVPAPTFEPTEKRLQCLRYQADAARALLCTHDDVRHSEALTGVEYVLEEIATQLQQAVDEVAALSARFNPT